MIRIQQIKLSIFDVGKDPVREKELLEAKAAGLLGCRKKDIRKLKIVRRSVDARDKDHILFVYTLQVRLHDSLVGPSAETELAYIRKIHKPQISQETKEPFAIPQRKDGQPAPGALRPVIIGTGPCGLFAALVLSECGLCPVLIERGGPVEERVRRTNLFFESGKLDPECNVQFGEGGAGTFSDGKLNTSIKDPGGFIEFVLRTFVRFGADPAILYDQKPHIGTDVLTDILVRIREHIVSLGGEYHFHTRLDGLKVEDGCLKGLICTDLKGHKQFDIPCTKALIAIGHSARDTYGMLQDAGLSLEAKSFAVGVRVQHPQDLIDEALYGSRDLALKQEILGPAAYKLTHRAANGRSIYSFCMCPGGYVVNSSSEEGRLCVNGMSLHLRDSGTANAALIVNVDPSDFAEAAAEQGIAPEDPLAGVAFQRRLEEEAWKLSEGCIPYETYGEWKQAEASPKGFGSFEPRFMGYAAAADLHRLLPSYVAEALTDGMQAFGRQIKGYDNPDTLICGIEARTSSPVRILRDETRQTENVRGLYPAGEGAGYAGGITSAAVDGIRSALAMMEEEGTDL